MAFVFGATYWIASPLYLLINVPVKYTSFTLSLNMYRLLLFRCLC